MYIPQPGCSVGNLPGTASMLHLAILSAVQQWFKMTSHERRSGVPNSLSIRWTGCVSNSVCTINSLACQSLPFESRVQARAPD
jgi:hypothetical protein